MLPAASCEHFTRVRKAGLLTLLKLPTIPELTFECFELQNRLLRQAVQQVVENLFPRGEAAGLYPKIP